jgi:hypothetical protein
MLKSTLSSLLFHVLLASNKIQPLLSYPLRGEGVTTTKKADSNKRNLVHDVLKNENEFSRNLKKRHGNKKEKSSKKENKAKHKSDNDTTGVGEKWKTSPEENIEAIYENKQSGDNEQNVFSIHEYDEFSQFGSNNGSNLDQGEENNEKLHSGVESGGSYYWWYLYYHNDDAEEESDHAYYNEYQEDVADERTSSNFGSEDIVTSEPETIDTSYYGWWW